MTSSERWVLSCLVPNFAFRVFPKWVTMHKAPPLPAKSASVDLVSSPNITRTQRSTRKWLTVTDSSTQAGHTSYPRYQCGPSGDIGEIQPSGVIKIIDRIKNIFKLSQGEYVAVEKIESALQQALTVGQIWVYGDSHQRFLVAIVHPNVYKVRHLVHDNASLDEICKSEAVKTEVLKDLTETGRAAGLKGFERVQSIGLVTEEFTVENGLMTPSQKLKRHDLLKRYKEIIDGLYSESNTS